jgi:hypothetical protein
MLSWNEIKVIDFFSTKMKGDIHFEITWSFIEKVRIISELNMTLWRFSLTLISIHWNEYSRKFTWTFEFHLRRLLNIDIICLPPENLILITFHLQEETGLLKSVYN